MKVQWGQRKHNLLFAQEESRSPTRTIGILQGSSWSVCTNNRVLLQILKEKPWGKGEKGGKKKRNSPADTLLLKKDSSLARFSGRIVATRQSSPSNGLKGHHDLSWHRMHQDWFMLIWILQFNKKIPLGIMCYNNVWQHTWRISHLRFIYLSQECNSAFLCKFNQMPWWLQP